MKATYNSQYISKKQVLTFTYRVTGTVAELQEYVACQEANTGRAAGTWPMIENTPLFFLAIPTLTSRGEVPQAQYTLIFNQDKSRVIRDNSAAQLESWARINDLKEAKKAEIMAELELGLRVAPRRAFTALTAAPTQFQIANNISAQPAANGPEGKNLADQIMGQMGETIPAGEEDLATE